MYWTAGIVASLALGVVAVPTEWAIGQEVKTSSGSIIGHAAEKKTGVSEYLGIPFAKPPVGELRFAAPVKFQGSGKLNASTYSPDCAANFEDVGLAAGLEDANPSGILYLTELMQLGHKPSEDCLTLNVWTKPQSGEKAKAVLFWIYGGGFNSGNSANKAYDGQWLADQHDVVVVTINYRLNIFGFPGVPGVDGVAQNNGLMDQRMAVEWVRDNIAAFGGDPKRIMMFGESAGGASTDFYQYTYPEDPIIHASVAESGSVFSFADPQPPNNLGHWNEAAKKLNCPTEPAAASVKCMRTKSTEEILGVTIVENPLQAVLGHFGPTVDGKIVFGDYRERNAAGKFIQKPYMNGNNHFEAGLFVLIAEGGKIKINPTIWGVLNAAMFTCPIGRAAAGRSAKGPLNYRFRYFGDWANINLLKGSGAYHTAEIPMIFGTTEYATNAPNEPKQQEISQFMQKVWTSFAKDPTSLSKAPFNFPRYNPDTAFSENTLIGFGANNLTHQMLLPSTYDVYCETIDNIMKTLPGGIVHAIEAVSEGKDMGIPGLKTSDLPDMSPPELEPLKSS